MEPIIDNIIQKKLPCYFISPHLDDAALSAGGLITYLASKTSVKIVTIFTEATPGPNTLVMRRFLKKSEHTNAIDLFKARRAEDAEALKNIHVEILHLGFVDGSFRRKKLFVPKFLENLLPELTHSYPLGRKMFALAREDTTLMQQVASRLQEIIPHNENHVIFCPLGTVIHMDHEITRKVCVSLFPKLIFWQDYPYITTQNYTNSFIIKNNLKKYTWDKNLQEKKKVIEGYVSQLSAMFPDGKVPLVPDTYFISKNL